MEGILDNVFVIGLTMLLAEGVKLLLRPRVTEEAMGVLTPLVVLLLAGGLNVANVAMFAPGGNLLLALRDGLVLGATAGGIYSMGKSILGL